MVRWRSFRTMAVFSMLSLLSCADSPPPVGDHLNASAAEDSAEYDEQVKARFPVGSDESALRVALARERFVIVRSTDPGFRFSAAYSASELFCRQDWSILWSAYAGKIADIGGRYWLTCAHDFM
jgi:hypothetical protein